MAAHVTVVDASARRVMIKVTPATYLSDVLSEACGKLKLSSEQFGLRHNKKAVDLSRTYRLSGLPSGAQLELVQASRSATVVNVALQLPESEGGGRLTEKFPSTTSFWQILRRFESEVKTEVPTKLIITQRGAPQLEQGATGAGRLYYEMPVINVMGRELSSFVDLQKTIGQLGINGSVLMRLSFRNTQQPLEEAMLEITQYFKETGDENTTAAQSTQTRQDGVNMPATESGESKMDSASSDPRTQSATAAEEPMPMEDIQSPVATGTPSTAVEPFESIPSQSPASDVVLQASIESIPQGVGPRGVRVFHAPSSNTPLAAAQGFNEADFVPTVAHAQAHQANLNREGRNRRLQSDREIETVERERTERLAATQSVRVRIRFPDMDSLEMVLSKDDTARDVYEQVRGMMLHPEATFALKLPGLKGPRLETLPENETKVIAGLGWRGGLQIHLIWDENVAANVRQESCLSEQWRSQRQQIERPAEYRDEEDKAQSAKSAADAKGKQKEENKLSVEDKMKKFLRFGKK